MLETWCTTCFVGFRRLLEVSIKGDRSGLGFAP